MKKLIATCVLLASVTAVSFAQSKVTNKPSSAQANASSGTATKTSAYPEITTDKPTSYFAKDAEKAARAAQTRYGLSEEQYKGVYEAEMYYAKQMHQASAGGAQVSNGQHLQMKMARDWGYKRVLTEEQYGKYFAAEGAQP
ncbi:hypothetical protein GCM10023093_24730 [Nemorincola caseinilytica]|uniref:Host cell surface-exposed lipoprotein n=1 Tax=Nemorincola caseinilytica TaxID=2054315 RepID=A0ABP8NJ89_9BACT